MRNIDRFETSASLETEQFSYPSPSEKTPFRRAILVASLSSLALVSCQGSAEEPKTGMSTEAIKELPIERVEESDNEDIYQAEIDRLQEQHELDQERNDPYLNEDEIVILQDEELIEEHREDLEAIAEEVDINVNHLVATGMVESCLKIDVDDSTAGARGVFQVMPNYEDWFREKYGDGPYDSSNFLHSARMGASAYAMLLNIVDTDNLTPEEILLAGGTAYNAGPARAERLVESGFDRSVIPGETQGHLEELTLIFDERLQHRDDTDKNRCESEDEDDNNR